MRSCTKKNFALLLCFAVLLAFITGCNNSKKNDIVGTYKNVGILAEENITYILREDYTYDQISENDIWKVNGMNDVLNKKGIYSSITPIGFVFNDQSGQACEYFRKNNEYYYITYIKRIPIQKEAHIEIENYSCDACFEKEDEYGKPLTIDSNGKINQSFTDFYFPTFVNENNLMQLYTVTIEFSDDGIFTLSTHKGYFRNVPVDVKIYVGTYAVDGNVIKLYYDESEHILLVIDNKIYYDVIQKVD